MKLNIYNFRYIGLTDKKYVTKLRLQKTIKNLCINFLSSADTDKNTKNNVDNIIANARHESCGTIARGCRLQS